MNIMEVPSSGNIFIMHKHLPQHAFVVYSSILKAFSNISLKFDDDFTGMFVINCSILYILQSVLKTRFVCIFFRLGVTLIAFSAANVVMLGQS